MSLLSCFSNCFRGRKPGDPAVQKALVAIFGDGDVAIPGDLLYAQWAKPYNMDKSMVVSPVAVVLPENAQEIAEVVKYAHKNGYKIQARSGGHSYA